MSNVLKKGELSVKIEKDRSKYWIGLFVVEVRGVEPIPYTLILLSILFKPISLTTDRET